MDDKIKDLVNRLATDNETRELIARHYFKSEQAKNLMGDAGFGVTGTDILETVKQVLASNQDLY